MKADEIYEAWKESRKQQEVDDAFCGQVMGRIYRYERERDKSFAKVFVELVTAHPLIQAAMFAAGAAAGFVRLVFVIYALAFAG